MPSQYSRRRPSRSRSPGPSTGPCRDYRASSSSPSCRASPVEHSRSSSRSLTLRRRTNVTASRASPPVVYSRPPSGSGVLQGHANAIATTPPPSALRRHAHSQNSTGTPSPASQPLTPPAASGSSSSIAQMATRPGSVARRSAHLPYLLNCPDSAQIQQSSHENTGIFNRARDFTVTGTIVDASNVTYYNTSSNQFMEKLLGETIRGAQFDSSDRDPPPRCQPGTRLAILDRCISFISHCQGVKKMRWVVGVAGVGKSAIMQSVAESPELPVGSHASVFFSINGRDDGTKAVMTISYQLAAKFDTYRQVIEQGITRDPSLLRSSMAKQFNKLIVEPFIHNIQLNAAGRVLIIIDGLDECKDHRTQLELLRLISDLCLTHPSSPLVWLIASRPEPHITSFFSKRNVIPAYEKEEIPVNSSEARADVEQFLREKFREIKEESASLDPRWPEEWDFWKVANAAGGLFAYAHTVIRYIGDSRIGSPVSQLSDVLYVIDKHSMTGLSREEHPMALLDALYERILSKVAPKIMINTRKLLLDLASGWGASSRVGGDVASIEPNFIVLCNWLGMTADEAYAAVHPLHSILYVPRRDKVHTEKLKAFHKSFIDYISDFTRSGFFPNFLDEARPLRTECAFRILTAVPEGIELDYLEGYFAYGTLASGPVTRAMISLRWPDKEDIGGWRDRRTRSVLYKMGIEEILRGVKRGDPVFQSKFCIRFLTNTWSSYSSDFPFYELLNVVFDETRLLDSRSHGTLNQIHLRDVPVDQLIWRRGIKVRLCFPATTVTSVLDPWNSTCLHEREVESETGKVRGWTSTFRGDPALITDCAFCCERLTRQLEYQKAHSPGDTALIMFTSTGECCVQVRLVDPEDDGMSEWTYLFWCYIPCDERKKYGSAV